MKKIKTVELASAYIVFVVNWIYWKFYILSQIDSQMENFHEKLSILSDIALSPSISLFIWKTSLF